MDYRGVIITGTSGAGKTTIARKLCESHEIFEIVQATTTRKQRNDDNPSEYQYINEDEFKNFTVCLGEKQLLFFTIFLDASDNILDGRLKQRGEEIDGTIKEQRQED